jgi:hypothetical protein
MAQASLQFNQNIKPGSDVWSPSTETVWEEGVVLAVTGALSTIRTAKGDVVQVDLSTVPCFLQNPTVTADVTGLHYIHEPGILCALPLLHAQH